ncbi:hypothetical protein [Formosa sp. L2A11]|uniref:hypothetical protein n=1 Tax=Formosa sp. L2A11 TaxID=2686363 RepID=UPI00131D2D39|nr:hypothetical protein [Formosa sp. L2A11]
MNIKNKKRPPKQNFDIEFFKIDDSNLTRIEQSILKTILNCHKANCKREYENILNDDLCKFSKISENSMLKYRKSLEQKKFFTIEKKRVGKSFVLIYKPNWSKLERLNFIKTHTKSEFSPVFKKKDSEPSLKNGDELTLENTKDFDDEKTYNVKIISNSSNSNQMKTMYGRDIKRALKAEDNRLKYGERENIYKLK